MRSSARSRSLNDIPLRLKVASLQNVVKDALIDNELILILKVV
jgi:hypothetical protein